MFKDYSPRLIFGVMAVTCIIISPLFAIFVPMTVPDLFLTDRSYFYIYSFRTNVKIIIAGFVILAAAFAMLCWKRQIATYVLSLLLLIGGLVTLYSSTSTYTAINEQVVFKSQLIGSEKMQWDSIERVALEFVPNALGNYKFIDKSGNELIVQEDKSMATSYIYLMASKKNIKFDEYEKK
ncbi:ATP-dependent exonuclease [Solibacillus sp. FSL W7-1472]|uniref:ATP-dependent exonuclease n=1 Tax=unclassified Solibacillus TaxID=2637870 RepID=UPI0030DACD46